MLTTYERAASPILERSGDKSYTVSPAKSPPYLLKISLYTLTGIPENPNTPYIANRHGNI